LHSGTISTQLLLLLRKIFVDRTKQVKIKEAYFNSERMMANPELGVLLSTKLSPSPGGICVLKTQKNILIE